MNRVGNLFPSIADFGNLCRAFYKALSGSGRTPEACRFHFHLEKEILALKEELESGTYRPRPYRYFRICDPKERTISVAAFRDRVVHHALVAVLEPIYEKRFIYDSYATRKGKGTHRAVSRARDFLRDNRYFLKTDVEKYFDSIDHAVLLHILERKVKDPRVLALVAVLLETSDTSRGLSGGKGLPIGNLTSQFFANVYLDPFDHFVKDDLSVRGYLRYMDDLVFFSDSKDELKRLRGVVAGKLGEEFKLSLKERATMINLNIHGLSFLGFRIFPRIVRARRENVKRSLSRLKRKAREVWKGRETEETLAMSERSVFEHLGHGDTYRLRKVLLSSDFRAGAEGGSNRVNRGGSWNNNARNCRSANRNRNDPGNRNNNLGFRLAARPVPGPARLRIGRV